MPTLLSAWFAVNLAFLFTHELDAVRHNEWRILPGFNRLDDANGYHVFTWLHVPLFALLIWLAPWRAFQVVFDLFLIVHAVLHVAVARTNPQHDFGSGLSRALIFGGGLLGAGHLLALWLWG